MTLIWLAWASLSAQELPVEAPADPCATGDVSGCEARCLDGNAKACSTTGYFIETGTGAPKDLGRAVALYRLGCNGGDGRGCGNLGVLYENGTGVPQDVAQALVQYQRGCRVGDGTSCLNLGIHQFTGDGLGVDRDRALENYQKACGLGEPRACNLLGAEREASVPAEAVSLYGQGCEGGYGPACYNLARTVVAGHAKLPVESVVKLYETACDAGEQAACVDLGVHLLTGNGIEPDREHAARSFQNACESAEPRGCSLRGAMYVNDGQDAPGFALLELGCSRGDPWGCKVLEDLQLTQGD
jgi:TPR repeat protein